jgi:hypothetical protein
MGADFLLYCCPDPINKGWNHRIAKAELRKWVEEQDLNDIHRLLEEVFCAEHLEELYEEEVGSLERLGDSGKSEEKALLLFGRNFVKEKLFEAYEQVFHSNRRDTTNMTLEGKEYVFSGGMSWGDLPSEACDYIHWLDETGVLG